MSRLATDRFTRILGGGNRLRLDIGCSRLVLQNGQSVTEYQLPAPLKAGIPASQAVADLHAGMVALCGALPAGKRTLEITLSDALVRSWIIERLPGLASPQEIEALATDQMHRLFDDDSADSARWVIRVDATPFVGYWPAVALPKALLDLFSDVTAACGWRLAKVETRFVRRFNDWRGNPFRRPKQVVYCLDTSDGLTIGIRNTRQWLALRTHPPLALLGTDVSAMLRRDCRAAGLRLDDCCVVALHWPIVEHAA